MSAGRVITIVLVAMIGVPSGASAQINFDKIWGDIKKAGDRAESEESGAEQSAPAPATEAAPATRSEAASADDGATERPRYDRAWVREMQGRLKDRGHLPGAVDGIYGPGTRRAIRSFERSAGLEETGLPTATVMRALREDGTATATPPATREPRREAAGSESGETPSWRRSSEVESERAPAASESRSGAPATRAAASQGDLAREARERLNRLGYDAGPTAGGADARTAEAVRAFQDDEDLPVDGRITLALVRALREAEGDDPDVAPAPSGPAPAPKAEARPKAAPPAEKTVAAGAAPVAAGEDPPPVDPAEVLAYTGSNLALAARVRPSPYRHRKHAMGPHRRNSARQAKTPPAQSKEPILHLLLDGASGGEHPLHQGRAAGCLHRCR